jgi:pilus assembly protein CpaC
MMLKFKHLLILAIFSFNLGAQVPPKKEKLELALGQDRVVDLTFNPFKFELGAPGFVELKPLKGTRQILFKPLKKTSAPITSTFFNSADDIVAIYEIEIRETPQGKIVQELKEFLGDIEGLEINIKGGKVVAEGQIIVPSDIGRIKAILDNYKDVLFLVELAPQTQLIIAKKMQEEIQKNGMKNATVRVVNGAYWLEGVVDAEGKRAQAEVIARALFPEGIQTLAQRQNLVQRNATRDEIMNFIQVNAESQPAPVPKMVKVTSQFVELTKDYNKIFGFKWIPLLNEGAGQIRFGKSNAGGVSSDSDNTLTATISNLFPKLASAKSAGYARVIQSGVVVTEEKRKASVNKDSTKPFAIGTGEFLKSGEAKAGFKFDVIPTILQDEKVSMELSIGIGTTIGDPPETLSNTINTKLIVKSKETAAVGGIVINKNSTDFDRDPPFGQPQFNEGEGRVPLFSFLRSKSFASNRSQFVVFVTPEIIESASDGTEEIKKKFRQRRR